MFAGGGVPEDKIIGNEMQALQSEEEEVEKEMERKRIEELQKFIKKYTDKGYSELQAIQILSDVVEFFDSFKDPESTMERPPARYDNLSRDQLIDQILNNGHN